MHVNLSDVGHHFDGAWLFRGLHAHLQRGRSYAVTGPSGSGKSTLLHLLAGWMAPSEGSIERSGVSRMRWVFQHPNGTPRRTALDHVVLAALAAGHARAEAEDVAASLLASVALDDVAEREVRTLSGGQAQRLMLARALANGPDLLLIDEPTAQLDRTAAALVDTAMQALAERDAIVVVATHDQRTAQACTDVIDLEGVLAAS